MSDRLQDRDLLNSYALISSEYAPWGSMFVTPAERSIIANPLRVWALRMWAALLPKSNVGREFVSDILGASDD